MQVPKKYYIWLGIGILLLIVFEFLKKEQVNWQITYSPFDKIPYGCEVGYQLAANGEWESNIERSNKSFYEYYEKDSGFYTPVFIANRVNFDEESYKTMLSHVEKGNTVFIASNKSSHQIINHFGIYLDYQLSNETKKTYKINDQTIFTDSSKQWVKNQYSPQFIWDDSVKNITVLGTKNGQINFIEVKHGKGAFLLHLDPILFTNYYLLKDISFQYANKVFSLLPNNRLVWDDFLIYGHRKPPSEMRYVLSSVPMRIAFYLLTVLLLMQLTLSWRRKQRLIPIINAEKNASITYINTLTNLYLGNKNNRIIASYLSKNFKINTKRKLLIQWNKPELIIIEQLMLKSGKTKNKVEALLQQLNIAEHKTEISQAELIELNKTIQNFILN